MSDKVFVGNKEVRLSQSSFLTKGGEGSIYVIGSTAFKLYSEPSAAIPTGKISDLKSLSAMPEILIPLELITDGNGINVGITMRYAEGQALARTLTKKYRDANNLSPDMMVKLVKKLQEMIKFIHSKHILVVDMSERNFLVCPNHNTLYGVDTATYQTKNYPATAITVTVQDPHSKTFSEATDWYSFAVLSTLMFLGMHPYRGGHPKFDGIDQKQALTARTMANASIFGSGARVPPACLPFSVIPNVYKEWLIATLEEGKRLPPPDGLVGNVVISHVTRKTTGSTLDIREIGDFGDNILKATGDYVLTATSLMAINRQKITGVTPYGSSAALIDGCLFVAYASADESEFINASSGKSTTIPAQSVMSTKDGFFVKNAGGLQRVKFLKSGSVYTEQIASLLPRSSMLFEGVAIQSLLGAVYASIPLAKGCPQIRLPELDLYKIVDAKVDGTIMVVVGEMSGKYDRFVFKFDHSFTAYTVRKSEDVGLSSANFICLDKGVCLLVNEKDEIEIFASSGHSSDVNIVKDPAVHSGATLHRDGDRAMFSDGSRLFSFKMK